MQLFTMRMYLPSIPEAIHIRRENSPVYANQRAGGRKFFSFFLS